VKGDPKSQVLRRPVHCINLCHFREDCVINNICFVDARCSRSSQSVREKINEQELYESLVCLEILMFLSDAEKSRNGFKN
jgi:hypothetical protein